MSRGLPAAALFLFTSCRFGAPGGATEQGRDIGNLYQLFFYTAIVVGGITYALILWSAIRYRKRKTEGDELPPQFRYHVPLETAYTLIPILIVVGLFVATYRTERRVDRLSPTPAVVVNVTGFQWQWRFDYRQPQGVPSIVGTPSRGPTLVLPVGRTVRFNLDAEDVIHSFYVPEFLFKRDTIPGMTNRFDLLIPQAGTFRGECAEYCGLNHDTMTFYIRAVSPAEFDRWVAETAG